MIISFNPSNREVQPDAYVNANEPANLLLVSAASNVGGIPEIIRDGVDGFLISPIDVSGFANAIIELASSDETRRVFGESGAQRVKDKFCNETIAHLIDNFYQQTLN